MSIAVMSEDRVERIRAVLNDELAPDQLEIIDESHLHAGHAGAREGKGHFRVLIVSDRFIGLPLLKRHRLVYTAVDELMVTDIHALSIDARAPGE
jgi:BolA family transcriptional regulator, general stress-responsive regulator